MTRPVHPIADLFPMMTDEELANLAADIKANGLIHPIVVDKDGVLIDGRNRDRACEIAGIEPTTVLFEGDDPRAYIIASKKMREPLAVLGGNVLPGSRADFGNLIVKEIQKWAKVVQFSGAKVP